MSEKKKKSLGTVTTTDAAIDVRSCRGGGGGGGGSLSPRGVTDS